MNQPRRQKTYMEKREGLKRSWHLVDLDGKVLGRAAVEIAGLLIGKHKPRYSPHVDMGDYVVVTNAAHVRVTRTKLQTKQYYRHSGIPGGFKQESLEEAMQKHPARVVEHAVAGMLPKNKLRSLRMKRLKIYETAEHPHISHFGKGK